MDNYKSGFIAVMGRPNVGKSTLLNSLLHQKIAAVSPKPQTTRFQQFGILTLDRGQLIFIDTAGLHHPHHTLGEYMNEGAKSALKDADMGLLIVDGSDIPPRDEDRLILDILREIEPAPADGKRRTLDDIVKSSDLTMDTIQRRVDQARRARGSDGE